MKSIESKFRKTIDYLFEKLDIKKSEKRQIQFKLKIQSIVSECNESKLSTELLKVQTALNKGLEELALLENNISFFKHAKGDNPMVLEVRKNIENKKTTLRS